MSHECGTVRPWLWDFAVSGADESEGCALTSHVAECADCQMEERRIRSLSAGLRQLPVKTTPPLSATRLLVLASHVKQGDTPGRFDRLRTRLRLTLDNIWKPLAVPAAGGIMASLLCFTTIVDTLTFRPELLLGADMPVGLFSAVTLTEPSPFGCMGEDVTVQLTVDSHGRVTDFTIPRGKASPEQMQEIGNLVLYSTFTPAMSFGQKISSRILVDIHHVNVRG